MRGPSSTSATNPLEVAGGSGGSLLFPFATDAPTRWAFGTLEGMLGLLSPVMIGLAGIAA